MNKTPETIKEVCKNCKWFENEKGQCHRFPPVYIGGLFVIRTFTEVKESDFCGEFKEKEITIKGK